MAPLGYLEGTTSGLRLVSNVGLDSTFTRANDWVSTHHSSKNINAAYACYP